MYAGLSSRLDWLIEEKQKGKPSDSPLSASQAPAPIQYLSDIANGDGDGMEVWSTIPSVKSSG